MDPVLNKKATLTVTFRRAEPYTWQSPRRSSEHEKPSLSRSLPHPHTPDNCMQVVASETIELPRATVGAWQATTASLSGPAGAVTGGMAGDARQRNSLLHVLEGKMIPVFLS